MLKLNGGAVTETGVNTVLPGGTGHSETILASYGIQTMPYSYYNSWPVYVCTDKTKKAIDVLKALEADGLKVTSVTKFIALVEKIAAIL